MTHPQKRALNPLAIVLILSAVFFVVFIMLSGLLFMWKTPSGGKAKTPIFSVGANGVGVVELTGVILDSKKILKQLKKFEENKRVRAVVIRLDSPGGAVAPSQEIFDAVRDFPKPIVASMGSVAASGAYYIACGAKKIIANPGTLTGSIGVIMSFVNLKDLYKWAKIRRYTIQTGRYKGTGADHRDMRADERALLQRLLNDVLSQFKKAVAKGRKLKMAKVTAVADGRIFSGAQAKKLKLVDQLGSITVAVEAAAKLAGIKGKPKVIYPEKKRRFRMLDFLADTPDEESRTNSSVLRLVLGLLGFQPQSDESVIQTELPGLYWIWNGT